MIGASPSNESDAELPLSDTELAELALTVAVAQGFSKAAIAWGLAPELPTLVIPSPGT